VRTIAPPAAFLGLRVETDIDALDADIAILGVPHGWPYPAPGTTAACAEAPSAIRRRSQRLARFVGHWDFDIDGPMLSHDRASRIVDVGDVIGDPSDGPANAARTEAVVRGILASGAVPVCLGGDDSIPIPVLRAFADDGPITVVQIDAHLDFRDEVQGVRDGYSSPMRRASEMPHVRRIVHVGLRGAGSARPADVTDSRAAGNLLVTAAELHARGVAWLSERLAVDERVFLSFDCDGLDPAVLPAVSAAAPGGLTYEQACGVLRAVGPRLAGAAFTEYVPPLDADGLSAHVVTRLVTLLLAWS
jgi:agmatinase